MIQSGFAKGLSLETPEGLTTRPTSAKVRAAIANMLEPYASGRLIVDLCAGSGAIGFELISRGARGGLFIENNKTAFKCLKTNVYKFSERAAKNGEGAIWLKTWMGDANGIWQQEIVLKEVGCIWADPPYVQSVPLAERMLRILATTAAPGLVLAVESDKKDQAALAALVIGPTWTMVKQKDYGTTGVTVFQLTPAEEPEA